MPDYGIANSSRRDTWWTDVVRPLCAISHETGGGRCGISGANWKKARPIKAGTTRRLRDKARAACTKLSVPWRSGRLATPANGRRLVADLRAAQSATPTVSSPAAEPPPPIPEDTAAADYAESFDYGTPPAAPTSNFVGMPATQPSLGMPQYPAQQEPMLAPVAVVDEPEPEPEGMPSSMKILLGVTAGFVLVGGAVVTALKFSRPAA
jgi:hypothetical protein